MNLTPILCYQVFCKKGAPRKTNLITLMIIIICIVSSKYGFVCVPNISCWVNYLKYFSYDIYAMFKCKAMTLLQCHCCNDIAAMTLMQWNLRNRISQLISLKCLYNLLKKETEALNIFYWSQGRNESEAIVFLALSSPNSTQS